MVDGCRLEGELLDVLAVVILTADDARADRRLVACLEGEERGHFTAEREGRDAGVLGEGDRDGVVEVDDEGGIEVGPMLGPRPEHAFARLGVDGLVHGGDTKIGSAHESSFRGG